MSLKSKIEAIIYASEEPVTLAQLVGVLGDEALAELDEQRARQSELALETEDEPGQQTVEEQPAAEDIEADEEASIEEEAGAGDQHDAHAEHAAPSGDLAHATAAGAANDESTVPDSATEVGSQTEGENVAGAPDRDSSQDGPANSDSTAPEPASEEQAAGDPEVEKKRQREMERSVRDHIRGLVDSLIREYAESDRGIEVREVAGGYRFGTKPEYHDAVRGFVKSLKPALKLSLQALETLAVVAYKQPVTAAEISEIRGVDSAGVLGGLMTRKLIQTAGRKQVVGRPMLYKTTREFLVRFGLKDVNELPSIEEFEKMAGELNEQEDLPMDEASTRQLIEDANARGDAETIAGEIAVEAQPDGDGHSINEETADEVAGESTED